MKTDKRTRIPVCPQCHKEVTRIPMMGQESYSCESCGTWGPWTGRKTVRNPLNPKRGKHVSRSSRRNLPI